jgi:L-ascorbate metabolism protein UlaG (beta-lactamase superfamily)
VRASRADPMVLNDNPPAHRFWAAAGYDQQAEWSRRLKPLRRSGAGCGWLRPAWAAGGHDEAVLDHRSRRWSVSSPAAGDAHPPSLTFIGTATTLLRYGSLAVLTDPNFLHRGQRAYLGKGLWSTRRTEPAMQVQDLPPLDAVVLSHLHGDHFDRVARAGLDRSTPIITTPQAAKRLRRWGFRQAEGLAPWQSTEVIAGPDRKRVTAAPGRHAPGPARLLLPPVMGSVLEFSGAGAPLTMYVTGDTLFDDDLREVPQRHPKLDVGLWHLGGTKVLGLTVTMDGRRGADLLELVSPHRTIPVHYDDYGVFKSPLSDFLAEVERRGLPGVRPVARGETIRLPPP